jgi:hypothetical protein
MENKMKAIGPIEIKQPNGDYLYVEVFRQGDELITGTFTNACFLRDEWTVCISDYGSLQEALQALYEILEDVAYAELAA